MIYFKSNIAAIYGCDIRTLNRRLQLTKLENVLPQINRRKGKYTEDHVQLIQDRIGSPDECPAYFKKNAV